MANLKKLHEALTTLREGCDSYDTCESCPFYVEHMEEFDIEDYSICFFQKCGLPTDWDFEEPTTFRFFKKNK